MRKLYRLAAAAAFLLVGSLAGCALNSAAVANVQAQVSKACQVVQPTLVSLKAMTLSDPAQQVLLTTLIADNGAVCASAASLDTTSAQNLVNTAIPAVLQIASLLPIAPAAQDGIKVGLLAFQVAISAALTQYGTSTPVPVPADTVSPATPPATTPVTTPAAAGAAS